MTIQATVKGMMRDRRVTMEDVAQKIGKTKQYISVQLNKDRPKLRTVLQIADAAGIFYEVTTRNNESYPEGENMVQVASRNKINTLAFQSMLDVTGCTMRFGWKDEKGGDES